jgi:hypothetical protein
VTKVVTFNGATADDVIRFVHEQRVLFKPFRKVIVTLEKTRVVDLNRNELEFPGVTYGHTLLPVVLQSVAASFDPLTVHTPPPNEKGYKEFGCTARYPWAQDRVL